MPTPVSGPISLSDVQNELGFSTASLNQFYDSAFFLGGGGLMYHNLAMGTTNNTAADVIWSNSNNGGPYAIGNWYNYNQDPEFVFDYQINNNTPYDIQINLVIFDSTQTVQVATVFSGLVSSFGGTNGSSLGPRIGQIGFGGYYVYVSGVEFQPPPTGQVFGPISITVTNVADSDGSGPPGSNRQDYGLPTYLDDRTGGPPQLGGPPTPYGDQIAADYGGGDPIPINKRTIIAIDIT